VNHLVQVGGEGGGMTAEKVALFFCFIPKYFPDFRWDGGGQHRLLSRWNNRGEKQND
jgi:hypothetical protein